MNEPRIWRLRLPSLIAANKNPEMIKDFDDIVELVERNSVRQIELKIYQLEQALKYAMDGMTVSQKLHVKKILGESTDD